MRYSKTSIFIVLISLLTEAALAQSNTPSLDEAKAAGALRSSYRGQESRGENLGAPAADLQRFRSEIAPLLQNACVQCHGGDEQEADFRVDTLDPDLIRGEDEDWWLEVLNVLTNKEMPPVDDSVELADADRVRIIDWLSREIAVASRVRRSEQGHSSFRRMTRYEYDYALQDLLGLSYALGRDLPPDTPSEDGFDNSAEMLQMSATQFAIYRDLGRKALLKATVNGEQPAPNYYPITMQAGRDLMLKGYNQAIEKINKKESEKQLDPDEAARQREALEAKHLSFNKNAAHFINEQTGIGAQGRYSYGGARYSWHPTDVQPETPDNPSPHVLILPPNARQPIDLGDHLPNTGTLRVRLRASRTTADGESWPDLRISFGFQPSNDSRINFRVGEDLAVKAHPSAPQWYELRVPLGEISRNAYRGVNELGKTPNPSEYLIFQNLNDDKEVGGIRIEYMEITAPYHDQWPPESHQRVFPERVSNEDETAYARRVLTRFMTRAWRREVVDAEVQQKLALLAKLRPTCDGFQQAMIEVLATVISSPNFLYLVQSHSDENRISDYELATRLSMFLWSSSPDERLLELASRGELSSPEILVQQTERMLADPRAQRFSKHFVRGWLGMQLLDYLDVDRKTHGDVDDQVLEAMSREPIEMFEHVLQNNRSVIDFLHADYTIANQRLAEHYRIADVHGSEFRKVNLRPEDRRGGLLTQAGLLAMNSDGKDSNPLKRGIWLLERILHDPPPPPPPAVPEIDLTDPEIMKLTLKERLEDHRNDPACNSCHSRIDPWGIAFENFDAVGRWRDSIAHKPVDATSTLFNQQKLDGMEGLKRYLLENRQDQFARAIVHKLTAYALGRPLSFADRSEVELMTAMLRQSGDGLATLVKLIVTSDLFQSQ